jgi:hypothetical protein
MARASERLTEILVTPDGEFQRIFDHSGKNADPPDTSILKEGRAGKRRWNRIYRNHASRPGGHPASGNPAGSDPANPVPQTAGSSLQPGGYESDYEPIRRTIAGFRLPYARRPKIRHSL